MTEQPTATICRACGGTGDPPDDLSGIAICHDCGGTGYAEQPARRWYEYTIGLYIEAESEEDAWEQLQPLFRLARGLDAEGEDSTELEGVWPIGGPTIQERIAAK